MVNFISGSFRFLRHIVSGDWRIALQIIIFYQRKINAHASSIMFPLAKRMQKLCGSNIDDSIFKIDSISNKHALDTLILKRFIYSENRFKSTIFHEKSLENVPIDISIVTFNSSKWLVRFFDSIRGMNFTKELLSFYIVDNGSTDDTISILNTEKFFFDKLNIKFIISISENIGFGSAHNKNFLLCTAEYVLVTNVDLVFELNALKIISQCAISDDKNVAAWELRQKPYEHPKYYDPVSCLTNWNSHACVLLRLDALKKINGYDESIFLYGEDVEISYHLRAAGYSLKYCPNAVVWHDSYESIGQIKPLQYVGSIYANFYLRCKYGRPNDILAIYALQKKIFQESEIFPNSKILLRSKLKKLLYTAPRLCFNKEKKSNDFFPFRGFDYELTRFGAFHALQWLTYDVPLVSIITRTHKNRETYLRDAIISVRNQTYKNIEHIIIEDGGNSYQQLCLHAISHINENLRYYNLAKVGRCAAGNKGLEYAKGKYCLFLDDDDLLFADHVEVLIAALLESTDCVAAYSPAMEVHTDVVNKENGLYIEVDHTFPAGLFMEYSFEKLMNHNYIAIQSILFDRKLYLERGGFDLSLEYLEDWNLWVRYAWNNNFLYVPKLTSMYRVPAAISDYMKRFQALDRSTPEVMIANKKAIDYLELAANSSR